MRGAGTPDRLVLNVRRPGWRRLFQVVVAAGALALLVLLVDGRDGAVPDDRAGPMMLGTSALGALVSARAGFHPLLDHRTRLAWRALSVALLMATASAVAFAFFKASPGPGDYLRLGWVPVLLVGLLLFPVAARSLRDRQRLALDTGIVVSCGFVVLWYVSLGPALVAPGLSRQVSLVAVAFPLADLALLIGATKALLGGLGTSSRRPLLLVVCGLASLVVADTLMANATLRRELAGLPDMETAPATEWAALLLAFGLITLAAIDQLALADGGRLREVTGRRARSVNLVPYLALAVGYGLLLVVASGTGLYPWGGLMLGAVAMTGLVVGRQVLELRENHTLAVTDSMTGLATRSRFGAALVRALAEAERDGGVAAVLVVDVDDFKVLNDSRGHQAGDDLLVALAGILTSAVSRSDTVARMGGDEFAVLLPAVGSHANAAAVEGRMTTAMAAPVPVSGGETTVRASIGIAVSRSGDSPEELLHRADTAMYDAKRDRQRRQAAEPGAR